MYGVNGRSTNISYPELKGASSNEAGGGRLGRYSAPDAESVYSTDDNGYPMDVKEPLPVARSNTVRSNGVVNGRGTPGVGYAVSYYGPQDNMKNTSTNNNNFNNTMSSTTTATTIVATGGSNKLSGGFQLRDPPKGKFTLFPKNGSKEDLNTNNDTNGAVGVATTTTTNNITSPLSSGISTTITTSSVGSGRATPQMTLQNGQMQQRGSKSYLPSLDTWLRHGTVSPFGAMKKTSK